MAGDEMFNISYNGIITVNRGDSFTLPLALQLGNKLNPKRLEITENTYIYFGLMEPNQPFENALIRKKVGIESVDSDGNVYIHFSPKDTVTLLPGKYYYQIKLQEVDPTDVTNFDVYTIVDKTQFYIME